MAIYEPAPLTGPKLESGIIVPVPEAESVVARLRDEHDPVARLGVPAHITLLYPWLPPGEATRSIQSLQDLLGDIEAFDFELVSVRQFEKSVYLQPMPAEAFIDATKRISERWPSHPPYGGAFPDVIPHLTIGDNLDPRTVKEIASSRFPLPLKARAREAWLMTNDESSRWNTVAVVQFRGA
jgi:2'-5' RNA ligase superfamily